MQTMISSKMKWCWILVLTFGACFLAASGARAEGAQVYTLDQLIRMALEKNPELGEADQDVAAAKSDLAQAKAGQWAQMDVTGTVGPITNANKPTVVVDPIAVDGVLKGQIENHESGVGIFGRLDFMIVQPLYTFGKISHRQDAAALGVEVQQVARQKKAGEIILNVKQLYYALIVASQGKDAAKDADEFIEDAGGRIRRLLELGSKNVDQSDLYRMEAFKAEIDQFKIKAETGANMAYMALKQAVGFPENQELRLDRKELSTTAQELQKQEEYIRMAAARRPEFEQLKKGIEAQKSMVEATRADLYPSAFLAGIGSLAGAPGRDRFPNAYFRDEFNHAEVGVVLGTQWHFDLGLGKGKVDKERAQYQKLLHTKEFADRNIPLEVAKYYQDAIEAQNSFQAFAKAAKASRKWIVSAFSNFDMGVGTARDIFDAIDRYGKNQGEYLLALYNYHVALANLSYATGEYRTQSLPEKP